MTPEESSPSLIKKPPGTMTTIWVISFDAPDCPNGYTLRPQFVLKVDDKPGVHDVSAYGTASNFNHGNGVVTFVVASPLVWRSKRRDDLESILPPSCVPIGKQPGDAAHVVNVYIE